MLLFSDRIGGRAAAPAAAASTHLLMLKASRGSGFCLAPADLLHTYQSAGPSSLLRLLLRVGVGRLKSSVGLGLVRRL